MNKRKRLSSPTGAENVVAELPKNAATAVVRTVGSASAPTSASKRRGKEVLNEVVHLDKEVVAGVEWMTRFLRDGAERYQQAAQVAQDMEREKAVLIEKLGEARAEAAKATKSMATASKGTATAKAEVAFLKVQAEDLKAEAESAKAEAEVAKARETDLVASQGQVLRAFMERLFLCGKFSLLSQELALIVNSTWLPTCSRRLRKGTLTWIYLGIGLRCPRSRSWSVSMRGHWRKG